ncbi:DEKNAAC100842 [Brettanomyces naardenensis]|uniref:DEKNAAC100842 n=1 Tax=Brettanomyces naardenensis TaxID=13370 RepID=A0A448YG08_BRENA|nr:DEKNAAC100842 [Brettanomyces naardenensis]
MSQFWSAARRAISPFEYGDPLSAEGFWGPPTSTIDWCEENYVISSYAAEIINTVTNLIYVYFAFNLLLSTIRNKHGPIFLVVSLGLFIVGVGSWLFHATLWYEFQLLDELPMVYFTWIPFAYVLTVEVENRTAKYLIYLGVVSSMILFTIIYMFIYQNPVLHEVIYGCLNLVLIYRTIVLTNRYVTDKAFKRFMFRLLLFSLSEVSLAFLAWNLDTVYCSSLIELRRLVGLPLGIFLELHGLWHILVGLGIHHFILFTQCLNAWYRKKQAHYQVKWWLGLPFEIYLVSPNGKEIQGLQEKSARAKE